MEPRVVRWTGPWTARPRIGGGPSIERRFTRRRTVSVLARLSSHSAATPDAVVGRTAAREERYAARTRSATSARRALFLAADIVPLENDSHRYRLERHGCLWWGDEYVRFFKKATEVRGVRICGELASCAPSVDVASHFER